MKKICVVTATRAEYGVLRRTIRLIEQDEDLELCLVVTGSHLSKKFGYTIEEIEKDGFEIAEKIDILDDEPSEIGICNTMGKAMQLFGEVYKKQMPDMLLVVGDRYELIPICSTAMIYNIPVAHISGGEITEGAIDDCIRHSITKMSYLHFPGCEEYRKRIIQLGEEPDRVFNYGDVGVESICNMKFRDIDELEKDLEVNLHKPYACVTFHPVTLEKDTARLQVEELILVMKEHKEINFIVTLSNADLYGEIINEMFIESAKKFSNIYCYSSLGIERYLSVLMNAEFIMGNSSSGIIEAPSLKVPTINIGDRQKGRLRAYSVIDCEDKLEDINKAISRALSVEFRAKVKETINPYEQGNTSEKIVLTIKEFLLEDKINLKKHFFDVDFIIKS